VLVGRGRRHRLLFQRYLARGPVRRRWIDESVLPGLTPEDLNELGVSAFGPEPLYAPQCASLLV
jgi:hypothetical protein